MTMAGQSHVHNLLHLAHLPYERTNSKPSPRELSLGLLHPATALDTETLCSSMTGWLPSVPISCPEELSKPQERKVCHNLSPGVQRPIISTFSRRLPAPQSLPQELSSVFFTQQVEIISHLPAVTLRKPQSTIFSSSILNTKV